MQQRTRIVQLFCQFMEDREDSCSTEYGNPTAPAPPTSPTDCGAHSQPPVGRLFVPLLVPRTTVARTLTVVRVLASARHCIG
jgi:hypothetical protein